MAAKLAKPTTRHARSACISIKPDGSTSVFREAGRASSQRRSAAKPTLSRAEIIEAAIMRDPVRHITAADLPRQTEDYS